MPHSDAFTLKNSGLNEFLFAEVGREVNGSPLTILSVLARLGQDPWVEAARLAKLPKAALIDCLANSISQMPLSPQALVDARATAARLTLLLPSQAPLFPNRASAPTKKRVMPGWLPIVIFLTALAAVVGFEIMPPSTPASTVTPMVQPPVKHPHAPSN